MEGELKELLGAIREENASSHAETRRQVQVVAEGLHEVQSGLHEVQIITEGLRHEVQAVAEGVLMTNEKLDRLDTKIDGIASGLDTRVTRLEAAASRK